MKDNYMEDGTSTTCECTECQCENCDCKYCECCGEEE